jgi:hypothetical protein
MYIRVDGRDYWSPCSDCKDGYCSSCLLSKYREDYERERDKRTSAEFRIENELVPRIKAEERAYDNYVLTDRYAEWCDAFDYQVSQLVDMFDEDFDYSVFDFDGDDITSKVAKLIYESKLKGGEG